eukprot:6782524-Alexandrium_andersonii.AAC.1
MAQRRPWLLPWPAARPGRPGARVRSAGSPMTDCASAHAKRRKHLRSCCVSAREQQAQCRAWAAPRSASARCRARSS